MENIVTPDQSPFRGGEIITPSQITANGNMWFGYPLSLADIFLNTRKVSTANKFLSDIKVPWRVSAVNIVDGVTQWTVA